MNYVFTVGEEGSETRLEAEFDPSRTVLEALEELRGSSAPGLLYRHSCHHGSCGTCGALVNGKPRLMCLTKLGELVGPEILLEPLRKMEHIGGLAVWPGPLFQGLPETDYLRPTAPRGGSRRPSGWGIEAEAGRAARRLEDCIECGLCVEACPVERNFLGPAALLAASVELEKHPERTAELRAFSGGRDGVSACERKFECARACPQGLSPGRRIAELRRTLAEEGPADPAVGR